MFSTDSNDLFHFVGGALDGEVKKIAGAPETLVVSQPTLYHWDFVFGPNPSCRRKQAVTCTGRYLYRKHGDRYLFLKLEGM